MLRFLQRLGSCPSVTSLVFEVTRRGLRLKVNADTCSLARSENTETTQNQLGSKMWPVVHCIVVSALTLATGIGAVSLVRMDMDEVPMTTPIFSPRSQASHSTPRSVFPLEREMAVAQLMSHALFVNAILIRFLFPQACRI